MPRLAPPLFAMLVFVFLPGFIHAGEGHTRTASVGMLDEILQVDLAVHCSVYSNGRMGLGGADAIEFLGNELANAPGFCAPYLFGDGVPACNDFAAQGAFSFGDIFGFAHGCNLLWSNLLQNRHGLFVFDAYERNA